MAIENPYNNFKELRVEKRIIADSLEGKNFESILEVGTQWGEHLIAIKEKFPDKTLVGVDIDKEVIRKAKKETGLDLRIGTVFNLEFEDNSFDVVFTSALFCMLRSEDVRQGLGEIIRVAKKYVVLLEFDLTVIEGVLTQVGTRGELRTGANWINLFEEYNLKATKEKIKEESWDSNSWRKHGYVIQANLDDKT